MYKCNKGDPMSQSKHKKTLWKLSDLPELKTADNLAFKAEGIQVPQVKIIGAVSYHWGMVGEKVVDDYVSVGDYSIFDSTSKGITAHLLSEYQYRHMRIYRPRMEPDEQERLKDLIMKRYYYYGDKHYDYRGVVMVALWCLLRKLGLDVEWWAHNSGQFWCLEFNEKVLSDLWKSLVPTTEPPYPTNMENSPLLEMIWDTY